MAPQGTQGLTDIMDRPKSKNHVVLVTQTTRKDPNATHTSPSLGTEQTGTQTLGNTYAYRLTQFVFVMGTTFRSLFLE